MREQPLEGARHSSLAFLVGGYAMLGPFSISTYMPFFPALMMAMGASQAEIQQTLSAYLAAFGFMMLLHGPLSDAFSRRRMSALPFWKSVRPHPSMSRASPVKTRA